MTSSSISFLSKIMFINQKPDTCFTFPLLFVCFKRIGTHLDGNIHRWNINPEGGSITAQRTKKCSYTKIKKNRYREVRDFFLLCVCS